MNKNNIDNNQDLDKILNNLNYGIHYIKLNNKQHLYDICDGLELEESPLKYENNFLISRVSNLKIQTKMEIELNENEFNDIVFTPSFNEMLDLIHFGICTGTPILLEGYPGQGKQKVINYISDLLNYEVENIIITSNFTVDDLFKKTV